jgi:pSer/pThr/pTyr-binding forkhead associated (FHA) protein
MACIVIESLGGRGDLLPDIVHILDADESSIGRDESAVIQVLDNEVSRRHVIVVHDRAANNFGLRDCGSANGTRVNGHRIIGDVTLRDGDVIEVGQSRLRYARKNFSCRSTALQHFKREGEGYRGTIVT